jgi:hypothetical protein
MDEDWGDDEMGVAAAFVLAVMVGFVATTIVGAAIAWNVASVVSHNVHRLRQRNRG